MPANPLPRTSIQEKLKDLLKLVPAGAMLVEHAAKNRV